jgi:hypothetical protein
MESYELNINNFKIANQSKHNGRNPKWNPIPIVGITDGKLFYFDSCYHAARLLKAKNVRTMARNILKVCRGQRKTTKGMRWFYYSDTEKYKCLINNFPEIVA